MNIKLVDLVTINEAAKALKQKTFMFMHNKLYGLDNINYYLIHTSNLLLSSDYYYNKPIIIDTKELSAFIKSVTTETDFDFDVNKQYICTDMGTILNIKFNDYIEQIVSNRVADELLYIDDNCTDITSKFEIINKMKKADGTYNLIHTYNDNKYFITVFSGLIPVNKSDKISLSIIDDSINSFVAKFTVCKKKINIITYIRYLKV